MLYWILLILQLVNKAAAIRGKYTQGLQTTVIFWSRVENIAADIWRRVMDFDLFYSDNEYTIVNCTRKVCTLKLVKSFLLYFLCNNIYKINYFYHSTNLCQFTESYACKTLLQMPYKWQLTEKKNLMWDPATPPPSSLTGIFLYFIARF